jgi:hypothetical protein
LWVGARQERAEADVGTRTGINFLRRRDGRTQDTPK